MSTTKTEIRRTLFAINAMVGVHAEVFNVKIQVANGHAVSWEIKVVPTEGMKSTQGILRRADSLIDLVGELDEKFAGLGWGGLQIRFPDHGDPPVYKVTHSKK